MKEKIIFVFPGQGAQYIGMAKDIFREFAVVKHTFEQVSDIVHKDIAKICFEGPADILNRSDNTSLGTFAHSISIARIIEDEFNMPLYTIAYAMSGHSMGQYSALHCTKSLSFQDAVQILAARSTYMSMTDKEGGGMGCVVGLGKEQVEEALLAATGRGYAAISNHNAQDQFIISGQNAALDAVLLAAKNKGARIARRLNVSIPAHCELMSGAKLLLNRHLQDVKIDAPQTNWFSNQTANIMSNPIDIKEALADQMTNGVRWLEIMENLPKYNITSAYELGPGQTLTRLINRANVSCRANATDNAKNVHAMLDNLSSVIEKTR